MRIIWTCVLGAAVWVAAGGLQGCGAAAEQPAQAAAPQVDPRFATADALVEYYNSLVAAEVQDIPAILGLLHPETVRQRKILEIARNTAQLVELEQEVWRRFGVSPTGKGGPSTFMPRDSVNIVEREELRAKATRAARGGWRDLHLVKIGDRWWVSCYTLQYDPEFEKATEGGGLEHAERDARLIASFSARTLARIRSGEYASYADVRAAYEMQFGR